MKIFVTLKTGEEKEIIGNVGESLLDAIARTGLPLFGVCGGAGVCGSCVVRLDPASASNVKEPSDAESDILEIFQTSNDDGMRLACQIELTDALDGLRVFLP
ncbi:MAG: 2Fe-2S iron-sulfur cluster binding domain-containing protein [Holosporales bacterium]|nr:2Fe-2S iron-sulfur cluster binding domain-containing protein [Holosporales bacterium]